MEGICLSCLLWVTTKTLVIKKRVKNNCNTFWIDNLMIHEILSRQNWRVKQRLLLDYFKLQLNSVFETKFYFWKIIAIIAIVHVEPNAVKITFFQYEYHCNHYLQCSGHHTKLRHRTRSHLGVPLIQKNVSAMSEYSMWNIPRNETNLFCWINMKEIFVRVVCIDSQSQCDNGWDRSCGTNSHIPQTYRQRQHPHFAAAFHKLLKHTYTVYVTWRVCHVTLCNSFILLFIWPIEFTSLENHSFIWLTLVGLDTMYEYHYIDIMAGWRKKKQSLKKYYGILKLRITSKTFGRETNDKHHYVDKIGVLVVIKN